MIGRSRSHVRNRKVVIRSLAARCMRAVFRPQAGRVAVLIRSDSNVSASLHHYQSMNNILPPTQPILRQLRYCEQKLVTLLTDQGSIKARATLAPQYVFLSNRSRAYN